MGGEGRLLLSPGAVDMGGLWAVPELKDYDSLTPDMVKALYDELRTLTDSRIEDKPFYEDITRIVEFLKHKI